MLQTLKNPPFWGPPSWPNGSTGVVPPDGFFLGGRDSWTKRTQIFPKGLRRFCGEFMDVSKIRGFSPKMDGIFHGKPLLEWMTHYFWKHPKIIAKVVDKYLWSRIMTLKVEIRLHGLDPEIDAEYWELATFRHPSESLFLGGLIWSVCSKPYNDIQQPAKIWTDSSNQKGFSRRIHQPSPSFSRHHRKTSNFVMHEPTWRLVVPWNFEAFKNRRTLISRVKKKISLWWSVENKLTFFWKKNTRSSTLYIQKVMAPLPEPNLWVYRTPSSTWRNAGPGKVAKLLGHTASDTHM